MIRAFGVALGISTTRPIVGAFFAARCLSPHEFFGTAFWELAEELKQYQPRGPRFADCDGDDGRWLSLRRRSTTWDAAVSVRWTLGRRQAFARSSPRPHGPFPK